MDALATNLRADVSAALRQREFWLHSALTAVRERFARSVFGPFWLSLTLAIQVAAFTLVLGGLFGGDNSDVAPHIAIGILLWTFMAACLNESAGALVGSRSFILEAPTSVIGFVLVVLLRNAIAALLQALTVLVVLLLLRPAVSLTTLLALPGLALMVTAVFGASLFLAIAAAKYRDLTHLIANVLMLGFFVTPVLWKPDDLVRNAFIAEWNPLAHLLAVVRQPLLGAAPDPVSWWIAGGMAAASLAVSFITLGLFRKRLMHWI